MAQALFLGDARSWIRATCNNLTEGCGFENVYWLGYFWFDKKPFRRRLPLLWAKFALISFGLLRDQSSVPPVKV